ncbi:hypothetical protein N7450_009570 [Penicillium hetheringtonii]|uniref:Capsule polysaccharide biosynthesis protein n=1 Tax=Penicillium hetheringtonii TaxID=911720 RepID=A0AAD6GNW8_9EURO|nr:hypothetical protein N7450_009570 [Penicillium hetheringtonii]
MTIDTNLERHGLAPNRNVQVDVQKHEITNSLNAFTPVTSERNVWFFWDKGFEAMPPWIQRSVINCVKRHDKSWTFRLLNLIPNSPNHVLNYVKENDLPATAINGQMIHAHAGQHISDFVRLAVVYSYGGIYIDAGMIVFRDLDEICWGALMDPNCPYEAALIAYAGDGPYKTLNGFIAARKQNPFLYRAKQVFLRMWEGRTHPAGLHAHLLVRHLPLTRVDSPAFPDNADWAGFTDYLSQTQVFKRVRLNREPGPNGFDGPAYFREHVMSIDAFTEMCRNMPFGSEERNLQLLLSPRTELQSSDISTDNRGNKEEASQLVHDLLANSAMWKCPSGVARFGNMTTLAQYWNRPGHTDDDCRPGTWGEYLRYGSVYFRQLRPAPIPVKAPKDTHDITEVGLYEPVLG